MKFKYQTFYEISKQIPQKFLAFCNCLPSQIEFKQLNGKSHIVCSGIEARGINEETRECKLVFHVVTFEATAELPVRAHEQLPALSVTFPNKETSALKPSVAPTTEVKVV